MKTIFHPAADRGGNMLSWLNSKHSFSFGHFYNPDKIHFGALRVLKDDIVAPGGGFGLHPHNDMEIVSIPLQGALEHRDSMGNHGIIRQGDVQIMSAGTGIQHSEFNQSHSEEVQFLQIWVFPEKQGIQPHYDQKTFDNELRKNQWQILVAPDEPGAVKIHQQSWFSVCELEASSRIIYTVKSQANGVYFFNIYGNTTLADIQLQERDAVGIYEFSNIEITAEKRSLILAIEVPMSLP